MAAPRSDVCYPPNADIAGVLMSPRLVLVVRQNRQGMKFDSLFVQFLGFFRRGFAVDRAVIGLAVMDFARFLRETGTDIVRVLGDVLAQFLEFLPQLALGRRHHGDRRFSGWYRRRLNWRRRSRARRAPPKRPRACT